jgi:hypothetical protein
VTFSLLLGGEEKRKGRESRRMDNERRRRGELT